MPKISEWILFVFAIPLIMAAIFIDLSISVGSTLKELFVGRKYKRVTAPARKARKE